MTAPALNPDQQAAIDAIFGFLLGLDREFSISGPAGTGKTFLMGYITDQLLPDYRDAMIMLGRKPELNALAFTALTHKAAQALRQATGQSVETLHAFAGLIVQNDYQTGKTRVVPQQHRPFYRGTLVFVDEASMLDNETRSRFLEVLDPASKVIYLGDHCQLPPVNLTIPPIYAGDFPSAELRQPMRNVSQPALVALCAALRETVETGIFPTIEEVPGVIDRFDADRSERFVDQTFFDPAVDARILCYTNERVERYNRHLRNLRGYPVHPVVGEHLIVVEAKKAPSSFKIFPDEEVVVTRISPTPVDRSFSYDGGSINLSGWPAELRSGGARSWGSTGQVFLPLDYDAYRQARATIARSKDWKAYFEIQERCVILRQRDACTIHKVQGSTHDTVFIDLPDIARCQDHSLLARLLYVAVSRARHRVVFHGDLS